MGDIKHSLCVCGINIKSSCAYTKTNSSKGGILDMVWLLLGLPVSLYYWNPESAVVS